jgi:hypothetical protein
LHNYTERNRSRIFFVFFFILILFSSIVLVNGQYRVTFLDGAELPSTSGSITIDGILNEAAWADAVHFHDFSVHEKEIEYDLYIVHDWTSLYIGAKLFDEDLEMTGDWLEVEIDDENDNIMGNGGEDVKMISPLPVELTGDYQDLHILNHGQEIDAHQDGQGAFTFSEPLNEGTIGDYIFELEIPLDSGDDEDAIIIDRPFDMYILFFDASSEPGLGYGYWLFRCSGNLTLNGPMDAKMLRVNSEHGDARMPNPSKYDHFYNSGSSVTASVNDYVTEEGEDWVCIGWTGTGSVPSSGSGTSVTFTITQDSSITWLWAHAPDFRFDPCINGFQFDNTIPQNAVTYYDAYTSLSSASWATSIPFTYWSTLAWFSYAANLLQQGNCFGMVYTAKYYFQNPSMLTSNFPGAENLFDIDEGLIASEIVTNQFPGQEIIENYLLNDLALYLEIPSVTEQVSWILNKIDQNEVVVMYIDAPKSHPFFHHAVLAYDYEQDSPTHVALKVYDPNQAQSTLFLELDKDEHGNYEISGGTLVTRYGVTKFVAGDFYDNGWAAISDHINDFYDLVYGLVGSAFNNFIRFEARSPVNILVTAPDGLKVGYDNLTQSEINQISGASYSGVGSEPQTVLIPSPLNGNYSIDVFGTGSGNYQILVDAKSSETDDIESFTINGDTFEGKIELYSVAVDMSNEQIIIPEFSTGILILLIFVAFTPVLAISNKTKSKFYL